MADQAPDAVEEVNTAETAAAAAAEEAPNAFSFNFGGKVAFAAAPDQDEDSEEEAADAAEMAARMQQLMIDATTMEQLPPAVQRRLAGLKKLHDVVLELHAKKVAERRALETKYEELMRPLLMQRAEIIAGRLDPSDITLDAKAEAMAGDAAGEPVPDAEVAAPAVAVATGAGAGAGEADAAGDATATATAAAGAGDDDVEDVEEIATVEGTAGVPSFWLQVLAQNEVVGQTIQDDDEDALRYLMDVRADHLEDMMGFKITFHFAANPYFTNSELAKTYTLRNMYDGTEPQLMNLESTPIHWKPGKNLTMKTMKVKSRSGRRQAKTSAVPSFFNFFSPPQVQDAEDSEDEQALLFSHIDSDFELALTFRDHIVPRAYGWYTGEEIEEDSDDEDFMVMEDNEDEDSDDDEDADGGDDDDDDEEQDPEEIRAALAAAFQANIPAAQAAANTGGAAPAAGAEGGDGPEAVAKPECNQQ